MGPIYALSLLFDLGLAILNVGVHVRITAKSLRLSELTHLNLWFKVTGAAAAFMEGS